MDNCGRAPRCRAVIRGFPKRGITTNSRAILHITGRACQVSDTRRAVDSRVILRRTVRLAAVHCSTAVSARVTIAGPTHRTSIPDPATPHRGNVLPHGTADTPLLSHRPARAAFLGRCVMIFNHSTTNRSITHSTPARRRPPRTGNPATGRFLNVR
ncbi:predicted protein [Streptomyces sp. AA4]|nr:predicted protein [Streptomyces sp. AA4]